MQLRFAKSLCASSVVHGTVLAAVVGVWALPHARAKGRERLQNVYLEVARVARPEAAPTPPVEVLEPLAEFEVEEPLPETVELPLPPQPIEDESFRRTEFEGARALDRLSLQPRPQPPAEPTLVEATVTRPEPEPAAQEAVGEPDPVVVRPTPVHNPKPPYPRRALEREIEGEVMLLLRVDAQGEVIDVRVTRSSGWGLLDRAALAAVEQWRFEPGQHDGAAVEMELPWRLIFSLDS